MSAPVVAQSGDPRVEGHLHANGMGVITLARPEALNAADEAMVLAVDLLLAAFCANEACRAVLLEGSTPRAFCSGGDVKKIALQCKDGGGSVVAASALAAEYNLITRIARMRKPLVALMDGVTMGFGLGMSGHAPYRVVTDNTIAAMPENVIGLLPDVAFAHLAKRAPPAVGLWMALTGARVRHAKDLLYARLGTHYVPAGDVAALRAALLCVQLQAGDDEHAVVQSVLSAHARDCPDGGMLATLQPTLARVFGQPPRVADIVVALQAEVREAQRDGDAVNGWDAAQTLQLMLSGSPTSLMVTHMHYTAVAAADDDVEQVLRSEHAVCTRLINQAPDFYEGVRAALIDKDRQPQWKPATLEEVKQVEVGQYFEPLDQELAALYCPPPQTG